jgi:hypothetical protein
LKVSISSTWSFFKINLQLHYFLIKNKWNWHKVVNFTKTVAYSREIKWLVSFCSWHVTLNSEAWEASILLQHCTEQILTISSPAFQNCTAPYLDGDMVCHGELFLGPLPLPFQLSKFQGEMYHQWLGHPSCLIRGCQTSPS